MAAHVPVSSAPSFRDRDHHSEVRTNENPDRNAFREKTSTLSNMNHVTDWVAVIKPLLAVPTGSFVRAELLDICKAIVSR
jgi:hypothetical protein